MTFRIEGGACLSSTVRKKSQNWFAFSRAENYETLETLHAVGCSATVLTISEMQSPLQC